MKKCVARLLAIGMLLVLPSLGRAQSTDRSEMDQWVKDTASQGAEPAGAKITMANWAQYKQFMPLGMQKLFEGEYYWKILANVFWAYFPAIYVNTPTNFGSIWSNDRFGNSNTTTIDVVYRWSDFNTETGVPVKLDYAPGTWFTEWLMEETPEQARYTASLNLFFVDQEKNPFPDTFVFVPALRRSLRLASTARCSPVFGFDWSYDDAKTNGFNGSTSIYTGDFLADRNLLTLAHFNQDGAIFPSGYLMPLGF